MIYEFLNTEFCFTYVLLISMGDVQLKEHAIFNHFTLNKTLFIHFPDTDEFGRIIINEVVASKSLIMCCFRFKYLDLCYPSW